MAKAKSKIPEPRTRSGMCHCPVGGCDYKNTKPQSYRMHWQQKHSPKFRAAFRAATTPEAYARRVAASSATSAARKAAKPVGALQSADIAGRENRPNGNKSLHAIMLNILQSHGGSMQKFELLTAVKATAFETTMSDTQLTSYLSQRVRSKPGGGIVCPARGIFALGTPDQDYRHKQKRQSQPLRDSHEAIEEGIPLSVELALLRRQKQKAQEVIMKMTELLLIAVD